MNDTSVVRSLDGFSGWDIILHTEWARNKAEGLGYDICQEEDGTQRLIFLWKDTAIKVAGWIGEYSIEDDCGK